MNISMIAVPAIVGVVLSYLFQDLKPALEHIPGMRPTDASHNDGLRLVYGALAFLIVAGYAIYTRGVPTDVNGAGSLLLSALVTAGSMTGVAHIVYTKLSGSGSASNTSSASSAPSNDAPPALDPGSLYPPNSPVFAAPSQTPNGLPLTAAAE